MPQSSFNCTFNSAGKLAGKEKLFTVPTGVMAIRVGVQPAAFGVTTPLELDELCVVTTKSRSPTAIGRRSKSGWPPCIFLA